MSLLPFGQLPPHQPRQFVPRDFDFSRLTELDILFDRLESGLDAVTTVDGLEEWLGTLSEVSAVVEEEGSRRYIAMTCHTDDTVAERAYLDFVEQIEPRLKPRQFRISQLYLQHPMRGGLPKD